ncbi:MAG: hypothetical protein ACREAK_12125, partial [Nitrosarchaeum sp.]
MKKILVVLFGLILFINIATSSIIFASAQIPESVIGVIDIMSNIVVLDRELNKAYFTNRVSDPI